MQALLVIDMQNGFCDAGGSLPTIGRSLEGIADAVAWCSAAIADARRAGLPVIYTRHQYRPGYADAGANFDLVGGPLREVGGLLAGTWDAEVIGALAPFATDAVVDKCRFDAFLETSLDRLLQSLGVTGLSICGVVTNVCVESTVRSAFMRDYGVTMIADACAADTDRLHNIALEVIEAYGFASIVRMADGFTMAEQEVRLA